MTRVPLITEARLIFLRRRGRALRWTAFALIVTWAVLFALIYYSWRS